MSEVREMFLYINKPKDTTYLTHNFHPYAAKFIPQIPRYFIDKFTQKGDFVLDPFCGSGTTLVESILLGRNAIGIDIHPIAVLMSKVKTTPLTQHEIEFIKTWIKNMEKVFFYHIQKIVKVKLLIEYDTKYDNYVRCIEEQIDEIQFPNKEHWFKSDILYALSVLRHYINKISNEKIRNFLLLALSAIVVKVSNQESETRYVAINKKIAVNDVFSLFKEKVTDMIIRISKFSKLVSPNVKATVYQSDARQINFIPKDYIDFVITSPPYPNTYDYYLYHKLRMYVLGFNVKKVQQREIGSRHKHSSKKEGIEQYIKDMYLCFYNINEILKPNKYFVIVIGDSIIRGKKINGFNIVQTIAEDTNFKIIKHLSYSLDNISRLFNASFRRKNKKEHIIIMQKEG